jgi:hypothetical protein
LKQAPAEIVLCFLRANYEHRFVWNSADRSRVADLVNEAIGGAEKPKKQAVFPL